MTERIGLVLFGLGRAGTIHLGNIVASYRVELLYLVEPEVDRAKELMQKYLLPTKVLTPEEADQALEDSRVRGVVICSPTFAHEGIARRALQHGKAVFCEKPISEDLDATKACYTQAEQAGRAIFCSFNRRFDPSVRQLRNQVKSGHVGNVHIIKTCSRDNPVPSVDYLKISGGIFHDCAVHDLDVICWILGEFPKSVYAQGYAHIKEIREMGDVDTVAIVMKFASGAIATIDLSRSAPYGYDQRLEVHGSEGMITSENQLSTGVGLHTKAGCRSDCYKYSFPQRYAESYVQALEHFVDVIENKEPASVTRRDTINVTVLASACEKSCKTGLAVTLSVDEATGELYV